MRGIVVLLPRNGEHLGPASEHVPRGRDVLLQDAMQFGQVPLGDEGVGVVIDVNVLSPVDQPQERAYPN